MHPNVDELTVIEGGKNRKKIAGRLAARSLARTAGGLFITASEGRGVGIAWPQVLGVLSHGTNTLAVIGSFCLVTLYGAGVAALGRSILDRKISELREGEEINGAAIEKITIEHKVMVGGD